MANASFAPVIFDGSQRMKNVALAAMGLTGFRVTRGITRRLIARFPSSVPAGATLFGVVKSKPSTLIHIPLVSPVASVLNWKSNLSTGPPVVPSRHCSPV